MCLCTPDSGNSWYLWCQWKQGLENTNKSGVCTNHFPENEVCRDHYPTHKVDFEVGGIPEDKTKLFYLESDIYPKVKDFLEDKLEVEENLLSEYFREVHSIDIKTLLKIKDNVNNFKLKYFEKKIYPRGVEYWFKEELFLSISDNEVGGYSFIKHWKDKRKLDLINHLHKCRQTVETTWPEWKKNLIINKLNRKYEE